MTRYFCYDTSKVATTTAMEKLIRATAEEMYLDRVIVDPLKVVDFLKAKQQYEYDQNKRLKPVNIYFSDSSYGMAWIHYGTQCLYLKAIRED